MTKNNINPLPSGSNPPSLQELPKELMKKIEKIGKKTFNRDLLFEIVVELCAIRPRSITEIASLINRSDKIGTIGGILHHSRISSGRFEASAE